MTAMLPSRSNRVTDRDDFSLAAMVSAISAETWGRIDSQEHRVCEELHGHHGVPKAAGWRIPGSALRDLNVASDAAGGYLAATHTAGYLEALQTVAAPLILGARVENAEPGGLTVPIGDSPVTTEWLEDETDPVTESSPTFTAASGSPKILAGYCEVSRRLLLQSNAEAVLRRELRNAAGVALTAAVLNGSGASGEPRGIINWPSIGSFTPSDLSQAALRNAQADVGNALAVLSAETCGYVTTPGVAETLATRQRFTGSDRALWEGPSADGIVEGCRALATTGCPADVIVFGDWSNVTIVQWAGGLVLHVDPFTKFQSGIVGMRVLMFVDVVVTRPGGFTVASSVS